MRPTTEQNSAQNKVQDSSTRFFAFLAFSSSSPRRPYSPRNPSQLPPSIKPPLLRRPSVQLGDPPEPSLVPCAGLGPSSFPPSLSFFRRWRCLSESANSRAPSAVSDMVRMLPFVGSGELGLCRSSMCLLVRMSGFGLA